MAFQVLLVEPDAAVADEIRRAFVPIGFTVTAVPAGEAAVERCRQAAPDLILLAAELPDMSGFSVCNRLKRALASVPLLLYTSEATDAAIEAHRATRTRADDYLKKPFELAELLGRAAALLNADAPAPPPPPAPPAAPRLDGRGSTAPARAGQEAEAPPVLQRVESGAVAARGLAAALAAASAPERPARPPPAPAAQASAPPSTGGAPAASAGPPPVPPPMPAARPPPSAARPRAPIAKVRIASSRPDPSDVLAEWPRDPAPSKGTPEEKLEYFRDRLRARDAFLAKVRDAIAQMKAQLAELSGERDGLEEELAGERDRAAELEHRLGEAAQDAAAQAARQDDLKRLLEESESTRQSLSEVLNESIQQHETSEQQWSARTAAAEEARIRLEGELADARETQTRTVAALEADRADERARFEAERAEAEQVHARALAAEQAERLAERTEAAERLQAAEQRIRALEEERDGLEQAKAGAEAEVARLGGEVAGRDEALAAKERELGELRDEAAAHASELRAEIDAAVGRAEATAGELDDARDRGGALEAELAKAADARTQLDEMLRQARGEARAYEEKALAVEHAYQAKVAELAAAEQRVRDLGAALDEGRASVEGTRGELSRVESVRADAERRAAAAAAERDQIGREVSDARRAAEAERERAKGLEAEARRLGAEVQRLAKLEAVAEEAARLRREVGSLREMVQQRTSAAESASRAAQAAAAERARSEERLAVETGKLQGSSTRLESDLGAARRKLAELEAERTARAAELERVRSELQRTSGDADERRRAIAETQAEAEKRQAAEVARLKAALVDMEKHLEARARAELQLKKRVQELERTAAAPRPSPAGMEPGDVQRMKEALAKLAEEVEDLRGENDFLNGEVARYQQKNKELAAQVASLKES